MLIRNTHVPDVIKKLVEGMIRVADDQDALCRVFEDVLGKEGSDEGFSCT